MVLPPSKRQKAQKPHSCAVFLLLKCFIFFRVQDAFLLEKNNCLFFKISSTRGPTGFFDSLKRHTVPLFFLNQFYAKVVHINWDISTFCQDFMLNKSCLVV